MTEPNSCESCIKLSNGIGIGSLLCDICANKPCSICNKIDECEIEYNGKTYKVRILGHDDKSMCAFCKEHQCYLCGEYDGDIDWEAEGFISYAGKPVCESCGLSNWCNECGDYDGGCDNRCPECEAVCDADCDCDVICAVCGVEFTYKGHEFRERDVYWGTSAFEEAKRTCSQCWSNRTRCDESNTIEYPPIKEFANRNVSNSTKVMKNAIKEAMKKKRQVRMSVEYVYGLENEVLNGIIKIGGCNEDPALFLARVSSVPNPLNLPFEWRLVNSKRVSAVQKKLESLYALIEKKRIGNSNCFRISKEEFNKILDVIDGVSDNKEKEVRDMRKVFKDKQIVRHRIGEHIWSGVYDLEKNVIVYNNESFKSPSGFALAHYRELKSERTSVNGWAECQIEKDGVWLYHLRW